MLRKYVRVGRLLIHGRGRTLLASRGGRILRLTPHRVRQMPNDGDLEGEQESGEKGGRWRIPKRAVHALLEERPAHRRRVVRRRAGYAASSGEVTGPSERELELEGELKTLNREMGRLELTELAESTLRAERERLLEDLEREKRRAESERAGQLEERLELSARAESSLRVERGRLSGDLAQERERANQLEEQLLRAQHDAERLAADLHAQRRRRGFWSRLFRRR